MTWVFRELLIYGNTKTISVINEFEYDFQQPGTMRRPESSDADSDALQVRSRLTCKFTYTVDHMVVYYAVIPATRRH